MSNSSVAGRRLALRVVAIQAVTALAATVICLVIGGPNMALGVFAGGLAMVLGNLVAAWGAFGKGVVGAGSALGSLLLGVAAKWLVVAVGLYLAMGVWRLPAMAVLVGAALVAVAYVVSIKFVAVQRSTTRTNA